MPFMLTSNCNHNIWKHWNKRKMWYASQSFLQNQLSYLLITISALQNTVCPKVGNPFLSLYIWYIIIRTETLQLPNNDLSFLVTSSHLVAWPDCLMVRACAQQVWECEFKFHSSKLSVWNQETLAQNEYQIY